MKSIFKFGLLGVLLGIFAGISLYGFFFDQLEPEIRLVSQSLKCPSVRPPQACPRCPECPECPLCPTKAQQQPEDQQSKEESDARDLPKDPCFPLEKIMTVFDLGGIGNKMSEYATLFAVAAMTGYHPIASRDMYDELSRAFPNLAIRYKNLSEPCQKSRRVVNPNSQNAYERFLTNPDYQTNHVHLYNYPNAARLFDLVKGALRTQFQFHKEIASAADSCLAEFTAKIPEKDFWFVSIHVRRTNYAYHLNVTQHGTMVKAEYFQRAIDTLRTELVTFYGASRVPKLVFVVTTDDPIWSRQQFKPFPETFFFAADCRPSLLQANRIKAKHLELAVASRCKHAIYDYGTFGFWGAYLTGGHVVLADHPGTGINTEIENIKPANLTHWKFIEAHVKSE